MPNRNGKAVRCCGPFVKKNCHHRERACPTLSNVSALAHRQTLARELPANDLNALFAERALDLLASSFGAEEGDAAAAARAADLRSLGPILQGFLDKHLHLRRGHARSQTFAPRISLAHCLRDRLPIVRQESFAHLL